MNIHNPLYKLLIEPGFRWLRHIIFILFIGIVTYNDILGVYKGKTNIINPYAILAIFLSVYLFFIYLNIYWSIPKLLLKMKYVQYFLVLLGTSLISSVAGVFLEYFIHQYYEIAFGNYSIFNEGRNMFTSMLFNYMMSLFYLTSISTIVFYKYWILNIKKIEQLKAEQLNSELNNLKNRISPDFLFDKLHKAAGYSYTKPAYTSKILIQLSHVLRYQLYDCSRDKVLLSSEIKYLTDYLSLEKVSNDRFNFEIVHPQLAINYLIPPLLLISLVEDSLKKLSGQNDHIWIIIDFSVTDDILKFNITDNRAISDIPKRKDDNSLINNQLKLAQTDKYSLSWEIDENLNHYIRNFHYKL